MASSSSSTTVAAASVAGDTGTAEAVTIVGSTEATASIVCSLLVSTIFSSFFSFDSVSSDDVAGSCSSTPESSLSSAEWASFVCTNSDSVGSIGLEVNCSAVSFYAIMIKAI